MDYLFWGVGVVGNFRFINVEIVYIYDYVLFVCLMNNYVDYVVI